MNTRTEQMREYRQRNKAKIIASNRDYYLRNKAKVSAKNKAYKVANRDRVNAWARKWRAANLVHHKRVQNEWRTRNRDKVKRYELTHRKRHPTAGYFYHIRRKYGITESQFNDLLSRQNQCCPICLEPLKRGRNCHVDHCHDTGVVRAILCGMCNTAIGLLRYSPGIAISAANYLNLKR